MRVATLSLQGKRPTNQDRIFISPGCGESDRVVAAVADGMGGMQDGDKAAEIAVETLRQASPVLLERMSGSFEDARRALIDVYADVHRRIQAYAEVHAKKGAVGTTLVTLIASGSHCLIANTGDSRCYLIDDSDAVQLTIDHTVADALLRNGAITPEAYASSALRNQLTKSLGPREDCKPDVFPQASFRMIDRTSTFLLCSDGFYGKLTADDFKRLSGVSSSLDGILKTLADAALERGTSDNLSAVVLEIGEIGGRTPEF